MVFFSPAGAAALRAAACRKDSRTAPGYEVVKIYPPASEPSLSSGDRVLWSARLCPWEAMLGIKVTEHSDGHTPHALETLTTCYSQCIVP